MNNAQATLRAFDLSTALWRKSSASAAENDCVEVADLANGGVAIRDSKDPHRTPLRFNATEWTAFREGVISGEI
ncbi:DUF397 domain-containing protein [Streptomyces syringium]|uniref:DUF397 domain-containing protein n=1 Tax=Streptomyces syringium TaxID=76729 RepID=UPI003456962E